MNRRLALKALVAAGLTATVSACATTPKSQDIVEIAAGNPDFSTLVAALGAAGLTGTLKGDGPLTVFAPTNAAFDDLPAGTVDSLLLPENKDQLIAVLTYHVVAGNYPAAALTGKRGSLTTVNGKDLHVDGRNGVKINKSNVTSADIAASNGTIHVIDKVLLP
ncbi:MAG: fasciclin domain-containing protein [Pseudoruegeria sp.]